LAGQPGRAMTSIAEQTGRLQNLAASRKEHILKNVPLSFQANQGQTTSGVKFLARGSGYTLFLKPAQFVVSLSGPANDQEMQNIQGGKITSVTRADRKRADISFNGTHKIGGEATMLRVNFVGADPHSRAFGVEKLPGTVNYFRGSNPRYWKTDIPTYSGVR